MENMATVKDIAAAVGVSVATVSNVLNDRPNVGRVIRQKVLRAAKRMGYRPNRAAQAMRTGRTRAIGLVLPDLTNPFFPELAQAVENTARSLGLLVCLVDSQGRAEGEADGFALLMQHAVDGIIWCPIGPRLPAYLHNAARPVVLIDRPRPGFPVVHSDYLMGGGSWRTTPCAWGIGASGSCPGHRIWPAPDNGATVLSRPIRATSKSPGRRWLVSTGFSTRKPCKPSSGAVRRH